MREVTLRHLYDDTRDGIIGSRPSGAAEMLIGELSWFCVQPGTMKAVRIVVAAAVQAIDPAVLPNPAIRCSFPRTGWVTACVPMKHGSSSVQFNPNDWMARWPPLGPVKG
jgi:hypothetical protein